LTGVGRRRYANDEERRLAAAERRRARTTDKTRTLAAASRRLCRAAALELCVTNQRAANALQHSKARARLSNEAREERRLADAAPNVERRARIARKDGIQAAPPIGLRDIRAPLANPNVQREILGRISQECIFCKALFWLEERTGGFALRPQYSKCCSEGKVFIPHVHTPLEYMRMLQDPQKRELHTKLRSYNVAFAFTSTRVQSVGFELGPGIHTYRVQGAFYHMIGGMEPEEGQIPRFLQAYVYDMANEVQNRQLQNPNLRPENLMALRDLLGQVNPYVNVFVQAANRIVTNPEEEVRVVITVGRNHGEEVDPRRYNTPLANEVAMILPGESGEVGNRDVIVQRRYGGGLLRMSELAPSYDPLQYPLLFLAGEDGWFDGLPLQNNEAGMRQRVTMAAFYGQRLHFTRDLNALHYGGRLFQQYIVDVAVKTEQNALNFLVHNQVKLRAELYQGLQDMLAQDAVLNAAQVGRRIVLPVTFHGSLRFMMQAYQDAMAIVRSLGIPDVFLTFTCNPSWPEIQSELLDGQTAADRPDLVARVFQMKVKKLLRGVCKAGWLAQVIGNI
jgi:hypothetical protein